MKLETLKEIAVEGEESFVECVLRLKERDFTWNLLSGMVLDVKMMMIKSLLVDNNVIEFKRQLYMAAKLTETITLAQPLNNPESPHYAKSFPHRIISGHHEAFYWALISEHSGVVESLAHLLGWKGEKWEFGRTTSPFTNLGLAIKYTLLGKDGEAERHIAKLKARKIPKYLEAYMMLLEAILSQSQSQAQEWLEQAVKLHRRGDYTDVEKLCAIPAIGLGWLAKSRGLEVRVDHPLAPGEVFESHDFSYPEMDFLPKEIQDRTWKDMVE